MSSSHVILCVDDEPQILEALGPVLRRKYLVKTAPSGSVALEILRSTPNVTVIISDMRMPKMNGAEFLSASRQIIPSARRILLTGHADVPTAVAAVNEGAICRLLTKPCPVDDIVNTIEAAMAEYNAEQRERTEMRRTAEKNAQERDALTGLATGKRLLEHLDSYGDESRASHRAGEIVFCVELVNAEELWDSHESGIINRSMRILVARLRRAFLSAECLARYRPETFVALLRLDDPSDAASETLARYVIRALERLIEVDGIALQYRARVGIAPMSIWPGNPRVVLRYAELAARQAAQPGRESICLYSQASRTRDDLRRETICALREAITNEQLQLHYQPVVDLERDRVYSLEALARWEDPRLGVISPGTFIPLAEEFDLMIPLGEWILNRACADAKALLGPQFPRVSVNVSVSQILHGRFIHALSQIIGSNGFDPMLLELELPEAVFAENLDRVCAVLSEVRDLGINVAIDDFGSGYSSLAYLSRLPVDTLKIDAAFVRDFDRGGEAIIGAALAVAKDLELEVIVEGIETTDSLDKVRRLGARKVQGYLFARPMPVDMLRNWHSELLESPARADKPVTNTSQRGIGENPMLSPQPRLALER